MKFETENLRIEHQFLSMTGHTRYILGQNIQRRENAGERLWKFRDEIEHVLVAVTASFLHSRGMPADQRSQDVILDVQISKGFWSLRHLIEVPAKITAGVGVESARARMHVNVNGSHAWSVAPPEPTTRGWVAR